MAEFPTETMLHRSLLINCLLKWKRISYRGISPLRKYKLVNDFPRDFCVFKHGENNLFLTHMEDFDTLI